MRPTLAENNVNVRANCSRCEAVTTFEHKNAAREYGKIDLSEDEGYQPSGEIYRLLRCAGCGRGALAQISYRQSQQSLMGFWPQSIDKHPLPDDVPKDIRAEFQEAELCASVRAWRSASAMLRSVLEKTLKANGYDGPRDNATVCWHERPYHRRRGGDFR